MSIQLALFLILMLVGVLLFVRWRERIKAGQPEEPVRPKTTISSPYHAVSIQCDSKACDAARELVGRRFLSTAAPTLPLPECDVWECNCTFKHYDDRRSGKDRRNPFSPAGGITGATGKYRAEQREGKDRRRQNHDDDDLDDYFG